MQQNYESKTVDLDLVVKGFPPVINKDAVKKIRMLNFQAMHRILINFYNVGQDEGYAYSDRSKTRPGDPLSYGFLNQKSIFEGRMIRRLDVVKENVSANNTRLEGVLEAVKKVFDVINTKENNMLKRGTSLLR